MDGATILRPDGRVFQQYELRASLPRPPEVVDTRLSPVEAVSPLGAEWGDGYDSPPLASSATPSEADHPVQAGEDAREAEAAARPIRSCLRHARIGPLPDRRVHFGAPAFHSITPWWALGANREELWTSE